MTNSNLDAINANLESLSQIWEILESNDQFIDRSNQGVLDTLSKLGIVNKEDIPILSPESIKQISNFLKLVPKKKFLANMSKIKKFVEQK
jgi:hypothetical protein